MAKANLRVSAYAEVDGYSMLLDATDCMIRHTEDDRCRPHVRFINVKASELPKFIAELQSLHTEFLRVQQLANQIR